MQRIRAQAARMQQEQEMKTRKAYATGAALHTGVFAVGSGVGTVAKYIGTGLADFAKGVKNGTTTPVIRKTVVKAVKRARTRRVAKP